LQKRLNDYNDPAMSGPSGVFDARDQAIVPNQTKLPLLPAEELAARLLN